jgi:hypothetical protein
MCMSNSHLGTLILQGTIITHRMSCVLDSDYNENVVLECSLYGTSCSIAPYNPEQPTNAMTDLPSAIHPDILPRLDPEYVALHNAHIAHRIPPHTIPWHSDIRKASPIPGGSPVRTVGAVKDISLQNCKIRAFIPEGTPPPEGWPVLLYIHGGENLYMLCSNECSTKSL